MTVGMYSLEGNRYLDGQRSCRERRELARARKRNTHRKDYGKEENWTGLVKQDLFLETIFFRPARNRGNGFCR